MKWHAILLFLHLLGITVWVGGMFLMHFVVRPVCVERLEPPQRLVVLADILGRFFNWVTLAIALVLFSGVASILSTGGFARAQPSVHMMFGVGLVMTVIFVHIRVLLFPRVQAAVAAADWAAAGKQLAPIRKEVGINLLLGILTIAIATIGRVAAM